MAYEYKFDEDEEKNQQQDAERQLGTESAIVSKATGPVQDSEKGSGQYTNLQTYLDANKDTGFAGRFSGKVGETVTQAEQAQSDVGSQFKQRADSSYVPYDEQLTQKAINAPKDVLSNQQEFERFKKQRDASYTGPKNLVDEPELFTGAQQKVQKAQTEAGLTDTERGRRALLDQYFGSGAGRYDYTKGQQDLDELLVRLDPESKQRLTQVRQKAEPLAGQYEALKNQLSQYAANRAGETSEAKRRTRAALGITDSGELAGSGAIQQTRGQIESTYNKAIADRNAKLNSYKNQLSSGIIDRSLGNQYGLMSALSSKGLPGGSSFRSYGVNPMSYYREGAAPNINQVMSKEQQSRYDALNQLAGRQNAEFNYADLAGTYDPSQDAYFDVNRLAGDIASRKSQYDSLMGRQAFTYGNRASDGNASFGPGVRLADASDPYLGGVGEYATVAGSLQDQINWYNNPNQVAMRDPNQPDYYNSNAAYYRERYGNLQKVLDRINREYGGNIQF
jgi:hypothetical protein